MTADATPPPRRFASIDDLFGHDVADAPTADVELPGGRWVRVRGLTRQELLANSRGVDGDAALIERRNLATCMVEPAMSAAAVERWHATAPAGDLVDLVAVMRRLSGLDRDAAKSGLHGDGDDRA